MLISEAAQLLGVTDKTIERWVDAGILPGGRPTDPATGKPVRGSHRWVDEQAARAMAAASDRSGASDAV